MTQLFLKILNMSINASYLIAAALLLRLALKKAPKWVNMLLWGGVALRLVCPFSIESALSLIPSAETVRPDIIMSERPAIQSGIPAVNTTVNSVLEHSFTPSPGDSVNPLQIWILLLAVTWSTGLVLLLFYAAMSFILLRRRVRTAVLLKENIFQSEHISSPFILGILRPRIFIPFSLPEEALGPVLAHERAHLRRLDYLWKPFGFLLLTIYWFNPLMWLSYALFCRDIELACDEKVIRTLDEKQRADYSQALLVCSTTHKGISACPLAFGESGVKERVKSVLNYKKPAFWIIIAAVAACIVVAICFLTTPAASDNPSSDEQESLTGNEQSPERLPDIESAGDYVGTSPESTSLQSGTVAGQPFEENGGLLDTIILDNVDLDHDGETERIRVYEEEETQGELYFLEVIRQDGTVIFSREAGMPHMGWTSILLYREQDNDYLIEYNPYIGQGAANYECTVFSLEQGNVSVKDSWTADFTLPVLELTGNMEAFAAWANSYLRSSTVLLGTLEFELVVGPVSATEASKVYPVIFDREELDNASLYAQMPENSLPTDILPLRFMFASGAGGWSTDLTLYPDGSFEGTYSDSEMGSVGPKYPNGTVYFCRFKGRFGQLTSLNEYSCSMHLEELTYETDTDGEWIEGGVRYIGSTAYGLEKGEEFIFYMPYTPAAGLDTEFLSWWPTHYLYRDGTIQTLLSYAIQNVNTKEGFFSSWAN